MVILMYGHIDCYKVCTNSIAHWTLTSQGGRRLAEEEKLEQVTHVRRDLPIQPFLSTERQRQGLGSVIPGGPPLSRRQSHCTLYICCTDWQIQDLQICKQLHRPVAVPFIGYCQDACSCLLGAYQRHECVAL
jgi:hypothetical protein